MWSCRFWMNCFLVLPYIYILRHALSQNRHGPHSKFENLRSNQLLFLVASQFKNLPRMNRESIVHIQIRRCGRWKLRYLNQYKIFECLLNGTLNQICFFLLFFLWLVLSLLRGGYRDCLLETARQAVTVPNMGKQL